MLLRVRKFETPTGQELQNYEMAVFQITVVQSSMTTKFSFRAT